MSENLMCPDHKASSASYREGYDAIKWLPKECCETCLFETLYYDDFPCCYCWWASCWEAKEGK